MMMTMTAIPSKYFFLFLFFLFLFLGQATQSLRLPYSVILRRGGRSFAGASLSHGNSTVTMESVMEKLRTEKLPIFDFKKDVEALHHQDLSGIELQNVISSYLIALQEHYFKEFESRSKAIGWRRKPLEDIKQSILKEANAAMNGSIPLSLQDMYSYNDVLTDLSDDIRRSIEQIESEKPITVDPVVGPPKSFKERVVLLLRDEKTKYRLKWLLSQVIMFTINAAQFKLQQYIAVRDAEKRLDDLPEFPIL